MGFGQHTVVYLFTIVRFPNPLARILSKYTAPHMGREGVPGNIKSTIGVKGLKIMLKSE